MISNWRMKIPSILASSLDNKETAPAVAPFVNKFKRRQLSFVYPEHDLNMIEYMHYAVGAIDASWCSW